MQYSLLLCSDSECYLLEFWKCKSNKADTLLELAFRWPLAAIIQLYTVIAYFLVLSYSCHHVPWKENSRLDYKCIILSSFLQHTANWQCTIWLKKASGVFSEILTCWRSNTLLTISGTLMHYISSTVFESISAHTFRFSNPLHILRIIVYTHYDGKVTLHLHDVNPQSQKSVLFLLINSEACCLRFPQVAIALVFTARMGSNRREEKWLTKACSGGPLDNITSL